MHLRRSWFILTLVAALLSACGAPSAQTPTAPADVTAEPTAAPADATAEPTAAPIPTVEPTAAATPMPQATVSHQFIAREFTRPGAPEYQILTYPSDANADNVNVEDGDLAEAKAIIEQWFIGSVWRIYDNGAFTFSPPDGAPGREVFGELHGIYNIESYGPDTPEFDLNKSVAGYQGVSFAINGEIELLGSGSTDYPYALFHLKMSYPLPDGRVASISTSINYLRLEQIEASVESAPASAQATAAPASIDMEGATTFNIVSIKEPGMPGVTLIADWFMGGSIVFLKDGSLLITLAPDAPGGESFGQIIVDKTIVPDETSSFAFTIERNAEGTSGAQLSLVGKVDTIKQEVEFNGTMIVLDGSGEMRNATLEQTILALQP